MSDPFHPPGPDDEIAPVIVPPDKGCTVTERYEQVDVGAPGRFPLFRVVHAPRHPMQTAAQDAVSRRWAEQYYYNLSVLRAVAHRFATELGFHQTCARRACRRRQACVSDRREDDWSFPGPWMPPCARTERLVDAIRKPMNAAIADIAARHGAME